MSTKDILKLHHYDLSTTVIIRKSFVMFQVFVGAS